MLDCGMHMGYNDEVSQMTCMYTEQNIFLPYKNSVKWTIDYN